MWENIINRVFANWKTSLVAVVLAAASAYLLHANIVGWSEWSIANAAVVVFLFVKDPKKAEPPQP